MPRTQRAPRRGRVAGWSAAQGSNGDGGLAGTAALLAPADAIPLRCHLGIGEHGAVRGQRPYGECVGKPIHREHLSIILLLFGRHDPKRPRDVLIFDRGTSGIGTELNVIDS